jgi:hypothetical protein
MIDMREIEIEIEVMDGEEMTKVRGKVARNAGFSC